MRFVSREEAADDLREQAASCRRLRPVPQRREDHRRWHWRPTISMPMLAGDDALANYADKQREGKSEA